MSFLRKGFLQRLLMIMFAVAAFEGAAYTQVSVTLTVPGSPSSPAPTSQFTVTASVKGITNPTVVFYRNDVRYATDSTDPYELLQNPLGQDTYTYRARTYDSAGVPVDSSDVKLLVYTPRVFRMGDPIPTPSPSPGASPSPTPYQTYGPGQEHDHTEEVRKAVEYLDQQGGGTLFFPCTIPSGDSIAVYNIKETIIIPSNVTLQGEGAEDYGKCRIYWNDVSVGPPWGPDCYMSPISLSDTPMFKVVGVTFGVRFKDLSLYSRTRGGPNCGNRQDFDQIALENTAAIEMNTIGGHGNITDVIVENVSIRHFKHGIRAVSAAMTGGEISDIKIRAYRALENHRQLLIDAKYAYNWDVQNLNINSMVRMVKGGVTTVQGGVEIINAGKPASPAGENTKLKFLQLNCNGGLRADPDSFCVRVVKHGGLYFRQMHHEGVNNALIVENISPSTNLEPIVIESGVATGKFHDASMKLYTIGSNIFAAPEKAQAGLDSGRMRFYGAGIDSTVVDCGDLHWDITNTAPPPSPTPSPAWTDLGMYYSHTERNRGSFFAEIDGDNTFTKAHTYCPEDINEVGGEYFDSGVMPTEAGSQLDTEKLYSYRLNSDNAPSVCAPLWPSDGIAGCLERLMEKGGSVYIEGSLEVNRTVNIKNGNQIAGAPEAQLLLNAPGLEHIALLQILLPLDGGRASGIVIRNLKLKTTQTGKTGIELLNDCDVANDECYDERYGTVGASSDIHFSGLTVEGFNRGFDARPFSTGEAEPMIDGISLKNISFVDNHNAVKILSGNASNWNIMNLRMTSSAAGAIGWDQKGGGHQSLQNVTCQGASAELMMAHCLRLSMSGNYLAGVKKTNHVTNALTIWESVLTHLVVRDSDFSGAPYTSQAVVNIRGRAFIVSLNNKYTNFEVETEPPSGDPLARGDHSRLTHCGDTYDTTYYSELEERHPNFIVGVPTLTRVQCGARPIPYDDAIRWTNEVDDNDVGTPLVGNFFHIKEEDVVVYRPGSQSRFLIQQPGGPGRLDIPWGQADDYPMIGKFDPDSRAQIVVWRPLNGHFYVYDPKVTAPPANYWWFHWGQDGDRPFIGNFLDESGSVNGNMDEVAVYRPSNNTFYISNPRSVVTWTYVTTAPANDYQIQVADFLGLGYDQIAQYKLGEWKITDPRPPQHTYTVSFTLGQTGDIPVAGKYLPKLEGKNFCAQIGVWRPSTQEFLVADPQFVTNDPATNCGTRSTISMVWGMNNDNEALRDIPLTIGTANGELRRPTAYRRTKGLYPRSLSDGQWWIHDPF